jgi:probable phosphoglycerate mutase
MLNLLIARHGNTFDKGDVIRRVGLQTDIPLSNSGKEQAYDLGAYLIKHYPKIDRVYSSELIRTKETAELALNQYAPPPKPTSIAILNEIDYGIDDGKPEKEVISRIGEKALHDWDTHAVLPDGWLFSKEKTMKEIQQFTSSLIKKRHDKTVLIITSNGIARFFPMILQDFEGFKQKHSLKLKTGHLASFSYSDTVWTCDYWGVKPS